MREEDILQGLAEMYFLNCQKCGQGNLSRDEVHQIGALKYICLKCHEKSTRVDKEEE